MTRTSEHELDARSARLSDAWDPEHFVADVTAVMDLVRRHLDGARTGNRPVWPSTEPEELLAAWPEPEDGGPVEIQRLIAELLAASTCQHHPGFVGQQLSSPPPLVGPVAMVSAILNNSAAVFEGAPVAIVLERRVVSWMAQKVGYGKAAGGVLTSGGTLGALTALLAMRQAKLDGDSWTDGVSEVRPAVFVSEESHYCNRRACAVLGLGERSVVAVPTDERFRMDVSALRSLNDRIRREGRHPIAVVANAGTTATGSHDDLVSLSAFCREQDLWLHVDAAHGGSALLSPRYATLLEGVDRADSVVWDAHKMMLMPSLVTAVLFRDGRHLESAFRQDAAYLLTEGRRPWFEPAARSFETTKPTMVFPLYVALRRLGVEFFAEYVEYTHDLARAFADEIERRQDFELLVRPESNIVCFRRRTSSSEGDALQLQLRDRINRRGHFFIMRTTLRGAVWLRAVVMNPATRVGHLCDLLDELAAAYESPWKNRP